MKPKIIHVPKEGVPAYHPPETPDTVQHKRIRYGLTGFVVFFYFLVVFGSLFGMLKISMTQVGGLGLFVLVVPVMADALIRPGKRATWLWTLAAILILAILPVLWFLFPVGLMFYQIIKTLTRKRRPKPRVRKEEAIS